MEFKCESCGRHIRVSEKYAGKRGRCPACKEVVTVPAQEAASVKSPYDPRLLDLPAPAPAGVPAQTEADTTEAVYERLRAGLGGRVIEREDPPERPYPWVVDILLYPLNLSAASMAMICVGIPFLLRVFVTISKVLTMHVNVLLILWVLSLIVHWGGLAILLLYMNWYVFQCVRDSAEGGIRAAETGAMTPGFGGIFLDALRLIASVAVCLAPAIVYGSQIGFGDPLFLVLAAVGGFAFPMALLAVVMHESLRGLNPLLLLRSIGRTLLPYCALIPAFYILCLTFPLAFSLILSPRYWPSSYLFQALGFCTLLIAAHLLGRLYWKNEEKLEWEA